MQGISPAAARGGPRKHGTEQAPSPTLTAVAMLCIYRTTREGLRASLHFAFRYHHVYLLDFRIASCSEISGSGIGRSASCDKSPRLLAALDLAYQYVAAA